MAAVFSLSNLDEDLRKKIAVDLTPKKETRDATPVKMYSLYTKTGRIYVPFYYAKCLSVSETGDFSEISTLSELDSISLNDRPEEQSIPAPTFLWTLTDKQVGPFNAVKDTMHKKGSVFLKAATASGKSVAIAYLACTNVLTLVYATNTTFITQITKTVKQATNAVVWTPSAKTPKPPIGLQVVVVSPKQFHRIPSTILAQIGLLIMDEVHLVCTQNNILQILKIRPKYIAAATATEVRRDGMDIFLRYLCGPNIIVMPLATPIKYLRFQTGIVVPFFPASTGKSGDWTKHANFIANCEERNVVIADLCRDILSLNKEDPPDSLVKTLFSKFSYRENTKFKIILITANAKDHNAKMINLLRERNISCDYRDDKKDDYEDCDVLVGYGSKNGTGFDQKTTCKNFDGILINVVIPLITSATPSICEQKVGRACRAEEAFVVDLEDGGPYNAKHYRTGMRPFIDNIANVEKIEYEVDKTCLEGSPTTKPKKVSIGDAMYTETTTLYRLSGMRITKKTRTLIVS